MPILCHDAYQDICQARRASEAGQSRGQRSLSPTRPPPGPNQPAGPDGSYQLPHGSSVVTAMTANSKVRYTIDRWNRRIGAGLALGWATPPHAPSVTAGPWPSAARPAAGAVTAAAGWPSLVRAITATRRWSRWASRRNQPPSPAAHAAYSQPAYGASARVVATMT